MGIMENISEKKHIIHYICKYTPLEILSGFGAELRSLNEMPDNADLADRYTPVNLCGYGRSVIELVEEGGVEELILVNCCDTMRRVYDLLEAKANLKFLYLIDLPHEDIECEKVAYSREIKKLMDAYAEYSGLEFDINRFNNSFEKVEPITDKYVALLGTRVSPELQGIIENSMGVPVRNLTCLESRNLHYNPYAVERKSYEKEGAGEAVKPDLNLYAESLLQQFPCRRMVIGSRRDPVFLDENLLGIVYHTIKFCDYYGFEYAHIKNQVTVPILKIETDYMRQSSGQIMTRIEAFAETIKGRESTIGNKAMDKEKLEKMQNGEYYVAGIDSGSTSTDVVIMNKNREIISSVIIPTGGGASMSAEKCLREALAQAGLEENQILHTISTGYGRAYIDAGDDTITEITCHAKGANYLHPKVRTIIDIGGQDSKAIRLNEKGDVQNFLMNDKCAAGTGRFLEMMSRALDVPLGEMSSLEEKWKENVAISSMCTVFAESEVVSLVAQNKALPDIIHGLNKSVATRVGALVSRLGPNKEDDGQKDERILEVEHRGHSVQTDAEHLNAQMMMTGGVTRNMGIVRALEEQLGEPIYICEEAQSCGAIGAALFALEKLGK